ncbi:nucleotidyltransferase family protein [Pseudoalteromonas sp.]|uniref:nucleotidyltransferase family protein n=1 Tax=Pseudoalteromonas sp. TaxID=53249 RepID=UPI0035663728
MIKLQKATFEDVGYLLTLRKLTMHQYLEQAGLPCTDEAHLARINYQFSLTHLIILNNQVAGMVKYGYLADQATWYIYQIQIHPDFQNKGLGSKVISEIIETANTQEDNVALSVLKQNPARFLYFNLGFVMVGEDNNELLLARSTDTHYLHTLQQYLKSDFTRMSALKALQQLNLPSGYIAAGFLRNLVWDKLHGDINTPLNDVDVIYYDASQTCHSHDKQLEVELSKVMPSINWQVKNQALMHIKNNDAAYNNVIDAMAHWPEKETAVAVKLNDKGKLEFIAAFGFNSLFDLKLSHNPKRDKSVFLARVESKNWQNRWPKIEINPNSDK